MGNELFYDLGDQYDDQVHFTLDEWRQLVAAYDKVEEQLQQAQAELEIIGEITGIAGVDEPLNVVDCVQIMKAQLEQAQAELEALTIRNADITIDRKNLREQLQQEQTELEELQKYKHACKKLSWEYALEAEDAYSEMIKTGQNPVSEGLREYAHILSGDEDETD